MARKGWTECPLCKAQEIAISETEKGTLKIACHKCEFSGFAKRGTKAHRLVTEAMRPDDEVQPAGPSNEPKKEDAPAAPTARRGFFDV